MNLVKWPFEFCIEILKTRAGKINYILQFISFFKAI